MRINSFKILLLLNFFLLKPFVYGQISISGSIIDDQSLQPLSSCKISQRTEKTIYNSNENGEFSFFLKNGIPDSIIFHEYGYEKKVIFVSENFSDLKIRLVPIFKEIESVAILAQAPTDLVLNLFSRAGFGNIGTIQGKIASYIAKSDKTIGSIKSVEVFLKSLHPSFKLKLNLYTYNVINNCPAESIPIQTYFIDTIMERGWVKIELIETVRIPKNGFCIGFELIPKSGIVIEMELTGCFKSNVEFGSYYEDIKNGNRTVNSYFDHYGWSNSFQNTGANVLNMAVIANIIGTKIEVKEKVKLPKFIRTKQVQRKMNAKNGKVVIRNSSIQELFQSIIKCLEVQDLGSLSKLFVVEREDKQKFLDFIEMVESKSLPASELENALRNWKQYLQELDTATLTELSPNYFNILFSDATSMFVFRDKHGWRVSETLIVK